MSTQTNGWGGSWAGRGTVRGGSKPPTIVEALEGRALLSGVQASYVVTNSWTTGLQAEIRLTNTGTTAVNGWTLAFDYGAPITSIWDASLVSRSGTRTTVKNASWNATIPAGGSVAFGFVAGAGSVAAPTNFTLNGAPLGSTTPPQPTAPVASVADVSVAEGNVGETNLTFTVKLDRAATSTVQVDYSTSDGTALAGTDYVATRGTLSFAPGETSKSVVVKAAGDSVVESDETFRLVLSNARGATLARASATGTIRNDDTFPQAGVTAAFRVTQDWGSGFQGEITVRNGGSASVSGWAVEFDLAGTIGSIWDGKIASQVGNRYTVVSAGWNDTIPAGGTVAIGFVGSPGGGAVSPTNFAVRVGAGGGGGGGGTPTNQAPTAVNDDLVTAAGLAATIRPLANDSDPNGDALTIASITQPTNGTAVRNADGSVTYTPKAGYTGLDSFTYVVSDGRGGTATGKVNVTVLAATQPAQWPERTFAPYVDVGLWPTYDLAAATRTAGVKYFNLGFVVADPSNGPSWGGFAEYAINGGEFDMKLRAQVEAVRALGGDAAVSFGGAANRELAEVITSVDTLKSAYRKVVDAYRLRRVDFDIEGAAQRDLVSVERRSQAIAALQRDLAAAGRPLEVWLTLPVLPTGLTSDGLNIVRSAIRNGVNLSGVNIMAMDYGDSAAPAPQGKMGDYAIQAAQSLFGQLKTIYGTAKTDAQLWKMVGVTPMIGLNDVTTEVFDQQEARELVEFARAKGMGQIAMWSLNRDRQSERGVLNYVETNSSSIKQQPFEFSKIFLGYAS